MSYEVLVKEAQTLTYEERVNLMAVLEKSLKNSINAIHENIQINSKLTALEELSHLYSKEELEKVEDSISDGITLKDVVL